MQINLDKKKLKIAFVICLALTIASPALFPWIKLSFFVPFLIIAFYQKPLISCLWLSFACGIILDLLSSSSRLGIYAISFCLTTLLLYGQRKNFFADNLSTLPIMTFAFSIAFTAAQAVILYTLDMQDIYSWRWIFTDLLVMPAADACYAFCAFTLPALLVGKRTMRGKDYFLAE